MSNFMAFLKSVDCINSRIVCIIFGCIVSYFILFLLFFLDLSYRVMDSHSRLSFFSLLLFFT
jgi:hypothetical protein